MFEKRLLEKLCAFADQFKDTTVDHDGFAKELEKLVGMLVELPTVSGALVLLKTDQDYSVTSFVTTPGCLPSHEPVRFHIPADCIVDSSKASFCRDFSEQIRGVERTRFLIHLVPVRVESKTVGLLIAQELSCDPSGSSVMKYLSGIAGIASLCLSLGRTSAFRDDSMVLDSVLELSPDLFWIQDEQHRFVRVNRAFLRAVSRAQRQVIMNRPEDFLLPKQAQALKELVNRVSETGLSSSVEPLHLSEDKDEAYRISMIPVLAGSSGAKFVGSARNVTRYARLKNEKSRLLELLGKAVYRAAFLVRTDYRLRLHLTRECATMLGSYMYQNSRAFDSSFLSNLRFSTYFYDIGMLTVDRSVLTKPGPLFDVEWNQITLHPESGARLLEVLMKEQGGSHAGLEFCKPVALYHHERYDGKGYPEGLHKDSIPLAARIMALCDTYGAVRTPRPYAKTFSHMEAVRVIKEGSGSCYDPLVVEAFCEVETHLETLADRIADVPDTTQTLF